ncbi:MAG: cyclic nucleotide-binding domain-containing protein, partial [Acidobacteriota bacterium]|nr:cyclic nucleotide-binding domain-containing protein [Acidobacteriota bacterium]
LFRLVTAAAALASSDLPEDVDRAEQTLERCAADPSESAAELRRQVARALGLVTNPRFRPLLVPLLYDGNYLVARAAVNSAGTIAGDDTLYVPTLLALMRNRRLKEPARRVLVGYGESVVPTLAYVMADRDEDLWVRRHVPATLARIPCQASVAALLGALASPDGFLRYKATTALARLHGDHPELELDASVVERQVLAEAGRAFGALTLSTNLVVAGAVSPESLLARVLDERRVRAMQRIFQLLALIFPSSDIWAVEAALRSPEPRQRSGAAELLDNMLGGEVRRRVMLLVEDMPADERVRKGNVIYKTRGRDLEDTIAQLVHDDNQVVAAAAVMVVEERGLWSLADDLEHVIAHRDVRDRHVFEAASWALAAVRMPAERRRQLWQEPLPTVVLVDRLRRLSVFDFTSVDELFRIAELGQQVRHEAGHDVYLRGAVPDTLQFILDGRVEAMDEGGAAVALEAPAPLAFEQILEGRPVQAAMRALEPTICLSISTERFLSLLAENVELVEGIMRWFIDSHEVLRSQVVVSRDLSPEVQRKVAAGLQPVDRVLLLETNPLLATATGAQLLRLASRARALAFRAATDPLAGLPEPSMLIVLTGTITVVADQGRTVTADSGDVIGMYQALSGKPLGATLAADTDGTALRFTRAEVLDVLADDTALLQAVFAGLHHAR